MNQTNVEIKVDGKLMNIDACIVTMREKRNKLRELVELRDEVIRLQQQTASGLGGGVEMKLIVKVIADEFAVDAAELSGKRRTDSIALPRHVVFYMARELTELSLSCIGGLVGGRDHGTVLHGNRHVRDRMSVDPAFKAKVEKARAACKLAFETEQQKKKG